MINALEKSFYGTGGKAGKDEHGCYFDLIRDRAINYIVLDEHGKFIVIDPRDKTPLKILMAYQESKSQLCDRIFIHSKEKFAMFGLLYFYFLGKTYAVLGWNVTYLCNQQMLWRRPPQASLK